MKSNSKEKVKEDMKPTDTYVICLHGYCLLRSPSSKEQTIASEHASVGRV
jgi:hypothetical protein